MWYGRDDSKDAEDNTYNLPSDPMPNATELMKVWDSTGLLEKLSDVDKARCAIELELANKWLKDNDFLLSKLARGLFLSLVRRMYDPAKLADFQKYARFLNALAFCGNGEILKDFASYMKLDLEVEYCAMCEDYMKTGNDIRLVTAQWSELNEAKKEK